MSIWNDSWLPENSCFKVSSVAKDLDADTKVKEMIDHDLFC